MRIATFYRRSLLFHWRTNAATTLCVATAAAVLTGALLVGDSMRGSLRDVALRRLGPVDHALVAGRFFTEKLASRLETDGQFEASGRRACPLILLQAGVEHAETGAHVSRINLLGIDQRFAQLGQQRTMLDDPSGLDTSVILNQPLAQRLQAKPGDDVLVRMGLHGNIPAETLLGQRDNKTVSLRLTVARVIPADDWGCFSLKPGQEDPPNAFVPLATLQRALKQRGRVNTVLVAGGPDTSEAKTGEQTSQLQRTLDRHVQLADLGLKLRRDIQRGYAALESESMLLPRAVETAALAAAQALEVPAMSTLTYLANTISVESGRPSGTSPASASASAPATPREIPYSTVTAIALSGDGTSSFMTLADGGPAQVPREDEVLLNEWAAENLSARNGDRIRLSYYVMGPFGQLETENATFSLRGVVRMQGLAADSGLTPEYEGVTNARHLTDWDPPFPVDLSRIRPRDEEYWDRYRATPKAFVSLKRGQALWATESERFGRLTQIRFGPGAGRDLAATADEVERELLRHISPGSLGLAFEPVRSQAIAASTGNTDFSMLFIGFSLFLIVAAAMLVTLVFRLGVDRRASEVGVLLAVGWTPRSITGALLIEGALLAIMGSAIGLMGALGYARLMLAGLQSWWADAATVPALRLHVQGSSLLSGYVASLLVGSVSIAWAVRGLSRVSPRSLLAGTVEDPARAVTPRQTHAPLWTVAAASVAAIILIILASVTGTIPKAAAFFASGTAMLIAAMAAFLAWTRLEHRTTITGTGLATIARLGIRNAARNSRRSLLTAGLIASATFIIIAVGANRQTVEKDTHSRQSGTGGFALVAESTIPILHDLNTAGGLEALSLQQATRDALGRAVVMPFRLRSGDEASCLNLYQPRRPRILGATGMMVDRGGFEFKATLAHTDEEKRNPWALLGRPLPDGAIPTIGDDNTVTWLLHLGLGKDLTIIDDHGREVRLRFVALLSGSVLQGELVIAESRFIELFPSVNGYSFFLIETSAAEALRRALARDLANRGFEVTLATDRLSRYLAVENAYLSAFQTLGGLGLILGTFGLAAVLLRSVFERRHELALLLALGWRRLELGWMVLAENCVLLLAGLAAGAFSALLAVAPHAGSNAQTVPWVSLAVTLAAVLLVGTTAAAIAVVAVMRSSLLPALRAE